MSDWLTVKQIVGDALDIAPAERAAFLDVACKGDAALRSDVDSLLGDADIPAGYLEPDRPPERIGVHRIQREIGRGGMGAVYLGERDDGQFEQRVAIKIIKRGMDSAAVLRRFYAERQILARLQHPNIARLLDGGITADGRPYFVMEYLEAEPIVAYATRLALPVHQRLALFITVCDAVEYSHAHLVLHRDIKPSNILVDASGVPKLLDFGIAKVLEEDSEIALTDVGARVMTPQYASPEQRQGQPLSTASDVYALGLLLKELIAAPATGDLQIVLAKALEEDTALRYQRAADLAADLRRYLARRPVMARPASAGYRMRKYVSRHWRALALAAALVIVVSGAIANALVQGRRAERRFVQVRQIANTFLFEIHDAIAELPGSTPARELVVKRALEYLDSLSKEAGNDIDFKRELAEAYSRVGQVQGSLYQANLGKTHEAIASLDKSVMLYREVYRARPNDPRAVEDLARAIVALVSPLGPVDPARATALRQEVAALRAPGKLPLTARAELAVAMAYFGIAEAEAAAKRPAQSLEARNHSIDTLRDVLSRDPMSEEAQRWLSTSLKRRAALYIRPLNDATKARADLDASLAIDAGRIARDPTNAVTRLDAALGQSYLSVLLRQQGDYALSDEMIGRAISTRSELLRADPANIRNRTWLMGDYAKLSALRRAQKRNPESLEAIQKGFDVAAQVNDKVKNNAEWRSYSAVLQAELAHYHAERGACAEASAAYAEARRLDASLDATLARGVESALSGCGKT